MARKGGEQRGAAHTPRKDADSSWTSYHPFSEFARKNVKLSKISGDNRQNPGKRRNSGKNPQFSPGLSQGIMQIWCEKSPHSGRKKEKIKNLQKALDKLRPLH